MENIEQKLASNPDFSVWVSASAGTGKTKVLTDRVLRLLIQGAKFEKILCLTFTNAASAEMQSRINQKLALWATLSPTELANELYSLEGKWPNPSKLSIAKNLYRSLLNSTEKINIFTIHSFCQKTLKRFPLESGINPGFQVLDEFKATEILNKIKTQLFLKPEYSDLARFFAINMHEMVLNDLFIEVIACRQKFTGLFAKFPTVEEYRNFLQANTVHNTLAMQEIYIPTMIQNLIKDAGYTIKDFFLNKDGSKRKKLLPAKIAAHNPSLLDELSLLQEHVYQSDQHVKTKNLISFSSYIYELAKALTTEYQECKKAQSLLDYDDLIYFTKALLTNSSAKEWVLYKLDGGIDHLLVDEAQDTSFEQWEIIEAITEEFFAGFGANQKRRTIFIVGDEKQSIFSFQGASLDSFTEMNKRIKEKTKNACQPFKNISLEWSYRSTEEILDVAYHLFKRIKLATPSLFAAENPKILPFREQHAGIVELWPLITADKTTLLSWPLPEDFSNDLLPAHKLAIEITNFIKNYIQSGRVLPSTGKPANEQDFMILVRRRDSFTIELINQLKKAQLEVAGIDRMLLNENLAILDLIAAAKFALKPYDDLNLACLLKSPIIGLSDMDLELVASTRDRLIWQRINELAETDSNFRKVKIILTDILKLYKLSGLDNFFNILVDCLGVRKVLTYSISTDCNDAIGELLYLAQDFSSKISNSLQNFIHWFEGSQVEIKRDIESSNKIRIMTVHGAKGLQAPVVIMADTTSLPTIQQKLFWLDNNLMISAQNTANSPEFFKEIKAKQEQKEYQEYLRLLYVAMTRAEDHLIVCGYSSTENVSTNCWYQLVKNAISSLGTLQNNNITYQKTISSFTTYHKSSDSNKPASASIDIQNKYKLPDLPKFSGFITSPLKPRYHLEYGTIFHKILEDAIKARHLAHSLTHPLIDTLPEELQNKLRNSLANLLTNKHFTELIELNSKAEVTIGTYIEDSFKIGRIDLLIKTQDYLIIIDYKSDTFPPENKHSVPTPYLNQLKFYKNLLQDIYPSNKIHTKILWLENGHLMDIE